MLRGIQFPVLDRKRVELIIVIGQSDILREKEVWCDPPGPLQGTCYGVGWTVHENDRLILSE